MSDQVFINDIPSNDNIHVDNIHVDAYPVFSVNGKHGNVILIKTDVGLDQVDNTSDLNKPLSLAALSALNALSAFDAGLIEIDINDLYTTLQSTSSLLTPLTLTQSVSSDILDSVASSLASLSAFDANLIEIDINNLYTTLQSTSSLLTPLTLIETFGDIVTHSASEFLPVDSYGNISINTLSFLGSGGIQMYDDSGLQYGRSSVAMQDWVNDNFYPNPSLPSNLAYQGDLISEFANDVGYLAALAWDDFWNRPKILNIDGGEVCVDYCEFAKDSNWADGAAYANSGWPTSLSGFTNDVGFITFSDKGAANGVASLDSAGKIPIAQLPSGVFEYKGTWNPSTNTPTLSDGTGVAGYIYQCSAGGTVNTGSGYLVFRNNDWAIHNGTKWEVSPGNDGVYQIAGLTGAIITAGALKVALALSESDISGLTSDLAAKAPLASPELTGTPTAPTATGGTNTTQVATTAFVAAAISALSSLYQTAAQVAAAITSYGYQTASQVTSIITSYSYITLASLTWANITGKPSSFAPSSHASSHASGGSDALTLTKNQISDFPTLGTASTHAATDFDPAGAAATAQTNSKNYATGIAAGLALALG